MSFSKLLYVLLLFTGLLFIGIQQSGCSREYSYEGSNTTVTNDSTLLTDSIPILQPVIFCSLCHEEDSLTLGSWNFKNNQSLFCGTTTDAGFIGTNTTFTFFGPSACSIDSGLVITVYLPVPFDEDKFNITSHEVAFYYYDHKSNADMFIKLPPLPFSLTVQRYTQATGIATGTFEGTVYTSNGDTTSITNGRFMVKLK